MKTTRIIYFVALLLFVSSGVLADDLPFQPGDPGGLTTPVDGGILMAILSLSGLGIMFFKKKKKTE